jgi:nitrogen PTS system EIIA component
MNRISRLLSVEKIVLDLEASSKKRLFEHVSVLFENQGGLQRSATFDSLFQRERLGSTGLGEAVAIPHGRIKGLREARAALVRLKEPIGFDAPDNRPVKLLIFLLVPEKANEEHLELLSELAELLSDPLLREKLLQLPEPDALIQLLNSWEPYRPAA